MRIRLLHIVLVAAIAPACLCAAQDGPRENSQAKPEDYLLLEEALRLFTWDYQVIVSPERVIVRSGASIVQDGQAEPMLELICEGRWAEVHDRAAATHDLYAVPDSFCDAFRRVFAPGGRQ